MKPSYQYIHHHFCQVDISRELGGLSKFLLYYMNATPHYLCSDIQNALALFPEIRLQTKWELNVGDK